MSRSLPQIAKTRFPPHHFFVRRASGRCRDADAARQGAQPSAAPTRGCVYSALRAASRTAGGGFEQVAVRRVALACVRDDDDAQLYCSLVRHSYDILYQFCARRPDAEPFDSARTRTAIRAMKSRARKSGSDDDDDDNGSGGDGGGGRGRRRRERALLDEDVALRALATKQSAADSLLSALGDVDGELFNRPAVCGAVRGDATTRLTGATTDACAASVRTAGARTTTRDSLRPDACARRPMSIGTSA